jgi:hypothetical protein
MSLPIFFTYGFAEYTSLRAEIELTISVLICSDIIVRYNYNYYINLFQTNILSMHPERSSEHEKTIIRLI